MDLRAGDKAVGERSPRTVELRGVFGEQLAWVFGQPERVERRTPGGVPCRPGEQLRRVPRPPRGVPQRQGPDRAGQLQPQRVLRLPRRRPPNPEPETRGAKQWHVIVQPNPRRIPTAARPAASAARLRHRPPRASVKGAPRDLSSRPRRQAADGRPFMKKAGRHTRLRAAHQLVGAGHRTLPLSPACAGLRVVCINSGVGRVA